MAYESFCSFLKGLAHRKYYKLWLGYEKKSLPIRIPNFKQEIETRQQHEICDFSEFTFLIKIFASRQKIIRLGLQGQFLHCFILY